MAARHGLAAGVPRAQNQVAEDAGADLSDRSLVAVLLDHLRVRVNRISAGGREWEWQFGGQDAHPVFGRVRDHVRGPLDALQPLPRGECIDPDQRPTDAIAQSPLTQAGRDRDDLGLDRFDDVARAITKHLRDDSHARPVERTVGQRGVGHRQLLDQGDTVECEIAGEHPSAVDDHRQLVGEELRHPRQAGPSTDPAIRSRTVGAPWSIE